MRICGRSLHDSVQNACSAGLAGCTEKAAIDSLIKQKLDEEARAAVRARINSQAQDHDSDSDDEGIGDAPLLPGERKTWVPPKKEVRPSPTPVPPHRRILSARNASSSGYDSVYTGFYHQGGIIGTPRGAGRGTVNIKLRPYSAPVRSGP